MVPRNCLRFAGGARREQHIDRRRWVGINHVVEGFPSTKRFPQHVPRLQRQITRRYIVGHDDRQSNPRRTLVKRNLLLTPLYETIGKYDLRVAYSQPEQKLFAG